MSSGRGVAKVCFEDTPFPQRVFTILQQLSIGGGGVAPVSGRAEEGPPLLVPAGGQFSARPSPQVDEDWTSYLIGVADSNGLDSFVVARYAGYRRNFHHLGSPVFHPCAPPRPSGPGVPQSCGMLCTPYC
jgi:hypothetical protein